MLITSGNLDDNTVVKKPPEAPARPNPAACCTTRELAEELKTRIGAGIVAIQDEEGDNFIHHWGDVTIVSLLLMGAWYRYLRTTNRPIE